jgi:hypothetical protein
MTEIISLSNIPSLESVWISPREELNDIWEEERDDNRGNEMKVKVC